MNIIKNIIIQKIQEKNIVTHAKYVCTNLVQRIKDKNFVANRADKNHTEVNHTLR